MVCVFVSLLEHAYAFCVCVCVSPSVFLESLVFGAFVHFVPYPAVLCFEINNSTNSIDLASPDWTMFRFLAKCTAEVRAADLMMALMVAMVMVREGVEKAAAAARVVMPAAAARTGIAAAAPALAPGRSGRRLPPLSPQQQR